MMHHLRRRLVNWSMGLLTFLATLVVILPLLLILGFLLYQGGTALNPAFFTQLPKPVGEAGGGMANATILELL